MGRNLNKVFWGMLIVFIDINLGVMNILPNFIGYLIIVSGLKDLSREEFKCADGSMHPCSEAQEAFKIGILPGQIMAGVTFVLFILAPYSSGLTATPIFLIEMATSVSVIGEIVVIYSILKGINKDCLSRNWSEKANSAYNRWHVYLVVTIAAIVYSAYNINFYYNSDFNKVLLFSIYGINFLVRIYLLTLVKGTSNAIKYNG
ncbi:MAG: hypothetical protein RR840_04105 [Clostridium sp.]